MKIDTLKINKTIVLAAAAFFVLFVSIGCSKNINSREYPRRTQWAVIESEEQEKVDCLLPSQIRKLGQHKVYQMPRQLVHTSRDICKIRGGEIIERSTETSELDNL